jgi:hypothetical protein
VNHKITAAVAPLNEKIGKFTDAILSELPDNPCKIQFAMKMKEAHLWASEAVIEPIVMAAKAAGNIERCS